ncbi:MULTISPECIES: DUF1214 domain-containing protein [Paraburkholderia]|uniref:DUF1214 domain-containing protein n=1 Tax=Paraburkholderia dioscoreae TaxID=2604047 RepID=A0A5Q4ZIL8_9BURK|nr:MULTISPECIES: DUF1214 domain-containing protein [Paraburkholderia]MDR8396622.1 DUF1214 domain-containing protein [Paraburkholderia sp. USG1]VVD29916.1 protein of unknown function [Paraburkholderia dioscoreae]
MAGKLFDGTVAFDSTFYGRLARMIQEEPVQTRDGGKQYILHVPANVPAKEFWAVTVYDNLTRSMIATDTMKAGVSSKDKLQMQADGSVDIYFGPQAPAGVGSNWVKTLPGQGWFAYFRWYGPTQPFFDKTWALPDIVENH